jgi:2'-5' RNA ligase
MRAFVGTLLSRANQDAADDFGARAAGLSGRALRPVPPQSAHLTHVFLGEIDEAVAAVISRELADALASLAPVPFQLGRPEVLRAGREARLVLAPVETGREQIGAMTRAVAACVRRQPMLARVQPSPSAHVTLARFRRGAGPREAALVADLLASAQIAPAWQPDSVAEVQLIRSDLTSNGPVYRVVARAPAGPPA